MEYSAVGYRLTMLFSVTTSPGGLAAQRTAGWSESVYNDTDFTFGDTRVTSILAARAAFLTVGASIVGLRRQVVDPTGPGNVASVFWAGTNRGTSATAPSQDYPSIGLYISVISPVAGVPKRPMYVRGIPDDSVIGGEWYPGSLAGGLSRQDTLLRAYLVSLAFTQWDLRYRSILARKPVYTITSTGAVVFVNAHGLAVGNILIPYRLTDENGRALEGPFRVESVVDTMTVTVSPWTAGRVVRPGTIGEFRLRGYAYSPFPNPPDNLQEWGVKTVSRKPGRPFGAFRGRASRRT